MHRIEFEAHIELTAFILVDSSEQTAGPLLNGELLNPDTKGGVMGDVANCQPFNSYFVIVAFLTASTMEKGCWLRPFGGIDERSHCRCESNARRDDLKITRVRCSTAKLWRFMYLYSI